MTAVFLGIALFLAAEARAERLTSGEFRAFGGQSAMNGERGPISGNLEFEGAAQMDLLERLSFIPSLRSVYEGTSRPERPLAPGNSLQQRMEHSAGLKAVYASKNARWRLKPSLRFRWEMLKETRDEAWLNGLFDSRAATAGMEAEYVDLDPFSMRAGVEFTKVEFQNFESLESRSPRDLGGVPLSRELAGRRVLDHFSEVLYAEMSRPLGGAAAFELGSSLERRNFPEQRVVDGRGLLSGRERVDLQSSGFLRFTASRELKRDWILRGSLSFSAATVLSNQNEFDARQGHFTPRWHNHHDLSILPGIGIDLGDPRRPLEISSSLSVTRRAWSTREAQLASGRYSGEGLKQILWSFSGRVKYPLGPRLSFITEVGVFRSLSNQAFEQFSRWNYWSARANGGFGVDF